MIMPCLRHSVLRLDAIPKKRVVEKSLPVCKIGTRPHTLPVTHKQSPTGAYVVYKEMAFVGVSWANDLAVQSAITTTRSG
jgi:hypothetical protein